MFYFCSRFSDGVTPQRGVDLRRRFSRGIRLGGRPYETRLGWINGLLSFAASYSIVYWCEQWVPSGLTAVLFATFPLFVALLAPAVLPEERFGARELFQTTPDYGEVPEALGTDPVIFPGNHGGFLGGEYGQTGDPDAFAAKLRIVLAGDA